MCALRRSSHAVYDIKYHLVWIPKYRKQILVGEVVEYTKEVFRWIGEGYGLVIETMDAEEDDMHIFLEALPKYSLVRVAQILKSISGREIFHRFPWLRQQLWGGGYFVRSVGDQVTTEIIRRHTNYQRGQAGQLKLRGSLLSRGDNM